MKKRKQSAAFKFAPFSLKQRKVLTWWMDGSPHKDKDAIICDGSVRAGKTLIMSLSFVIWAMETFSYQNFGMAGKTIGSFRRNVLFWLKIILKMRGYHVLDNRADNVLVVRRKKTGAINSFHIFGGKDERSQDLVQGITCAGFFFDEVALMPESFVNQATARCSVDGSKYWFNCNPEGPYHWFNKNWIEKPKEKNALHLHFTMDDNPSLTDATKERYQRMYSGVFFQRFILGMWVVASGIIYDMWSDDLLFDDDDIPPRFYSKTSRYVVVDYGTKNPMVFLDIYDDGTTIWVMNEYYYSSEKERAQKEDSQYADDMDDFVKGDDPVWVILDPSAASFKTTLRNRGYRVKDGDNSVNDGIRMVSSMLNRRLIRVHKRCENLRKEFTSYVWDEKAAERGEEKPVKMNDHCLAGETIVNTTAGNIAIKDLAGKSGEVFCFDEKRKEATSAAFNNVRCTGRSVDVFSVETEDGRNITATADHLVLTKRGWKEIHELREGDYIVDIGQGGEGRNDNRDCTV